MNADGSDITGITYPVKVDSSVDLSKYKQVTDSDSGINHSDNPWKDNHNRIQRKRRTV